MRERLNWYKIMKNHQNPDMERDFAVRISKLYRGRSMSARRCAYYVLKDYYSTTSIDDLKEKVVNYL